MKNIFNYLAVVSILFMGIMFASCSKDKDEGSSIQSEIVGTWLYAGEFKDITMKFSSDGLVEIFEHYKASDADKHDQLEYAKYTYMPEQNKLVVFVGDEVETHTISINGDTMLLDDHVYRRQR